MVLSYAKILNGMVSRIVSHRFQREEEKRMIPKGKRWTTKHKSVTDVFSAVENLFSSYFFSWTPPILRSIYHMSIPFLWIILNGMIYRILMQIYWVYAEFRWFLDLAKFEFNDIHYPKKGAEQEWQLFSKIPMES